MQEIQKVLEAYLEARVAGDADRWLSIWDEDGVQLFPGSRANDMDALRQVTAARFEAVPVNSAKIDIADITVVEDHAFAHGHFVIERVVEGAPMPFDGKFLTVLKRQADGTWKLLRDCANSNDH